MNRKGTNENTSVTNRNMAFSYSTHAHNYVKIAVSKEIYTKLTENVQNPRCTSHTTQRAEDRYPPHCSALIHANNQYAFSITHSPPANLILI